MSGNFIPLKVSAPRRLPQKEFKLPVEESIKIIDEVRKIQKHTKTIRPDQNRKQYQNLLEWANTSLQSTKQLVKSTTTSYKQYSQEQPQQETVDQQIQMQQRRIIQTLMLEMMQMFKRQCKQKSQLMHIIYDFFNQIINMYSKHYQKQYQETLKNYNIQIQQLQGDYEIKLNQCNKRISFLESAKQTKWKNIYMLAKDNRILRRQKGKLLRLVQEQDEKIRLLEAQLCQVVKQNQMNKLVIRFQNDNENLKIFMKNRLALMKFQKIIQKFPKKAMKVLNNDLLKLQIQQLNGLDSKIDYIKRVITQSGDIFDQYQDLNQLIARPNKMVFNVCTQTDPEDLQSPKEYKDVSTHYDMESRLKRFDTWEQIYDIKVVGWPEMREKHVHMKTPHKKYTTKPSFFNKKQDQNQPRNFFLLQISSGQVRQSINIKTKNNSQQFNRVINTGVTYNPLLKDKTKLYFVMPYQNRILAQDPTDDMDYIFKRTLPIGTKRQKQAYIRKSQNFNQKQSLQSLMNSLKSPLKQRNSEAFKLQRNFSQVQDQKQPQYNRQSPTIQQKSQFDSSINTQEQADQVDQFDQQEDAELYETPHLKSKKKRRSLRKATQLPYSKIDQNSTLKMSIFKEQNLNNESSSRYSVNIENPSEFMKSKKQRKSTQGSQTQRKFKKSQVALNKINRIKTSQNTRTSKIFNQNHKTTIDQIYEEPDQSNEKHKKPYQWESLNKSSRMSYMPSPKSLSKSKFSQTFGNLTNLSHFNAKENQMAEIEGLLAERSQKYHATNPVGTNTAARKISKLMIRNSSFNGMKLSKQRDSMNIDTNSIKSRLSSQTPSTFNYKLYLTQMQPKKSFQILQSEILNPVNIKNFQVKKLTEKIIRSMYTKRKQLLSSQTSTSLKVFIQHFLKQIYGNNWKGQKNLLRYAFTIEDRESSASIKTFSLMLNTNVQIQYLQDLFRLYVTMLQKNEFSNCDNPLIASKTKGAAILKYLLSVYFDQATTNHIQQSLPFMNQFEIDLNEVFIVVETHVRRYTVETQFYGFLSRLIPQNQSFIDFGQMKQLLYYFKNDLKYHAHIARLKYFFKTYGKIITQQQQPLTNKMQPTKTGRASNTADKSAFQAKTQPKQPIPTTKQYTKQNTQILPIHRVCLYLKRYQWTQLMEINSYVEEKYHKLVGVFIQQESIKYITKYCSIIEQRTSKQKTFYQSGSISMTITLTHQTNTISNHHPTHPLSWLLSRTRQLIRNYYRYKSPLDRHLLMFVHLSILNYELDVTMSQVLSEAMGLINLEYKRLRTKEEVDLFMKD